MVKIISSFNEIDSKIWTSRSTINIVTDRQGRSYTEIRYSRELKTSERRNRRLAGIALLIAASLPLALPLAGLLLVKPLRERTISLFTAKEKNVWFRVYDKKESPESKGQENKSDDKSGFDFSSASENKEVDPMLKEPLDHRNSLDTEDTTDEDSEEIEYVMTKKEQIIFEAEIEKLQKQGKKKGVKDQAWENLTNMTKEEKKKRLREIEERKST